MLLALQLSAAAAAGSRKEDLGDCLKDKDYKQLMQTVKDGLPCVNTSHHVVIVGAGMAGLTAAKLLQDAGHEVQKDPPGGQQNIRIMTLTVNNSFCVFEPGHHFRG